MSSLPQHLDLHLIRILYLLLIEKNVSRVALKLNQPQPSISASLRKLRELTGDPLLVRGARGMVPTEYGMSLLQPAKRILDETENLFVRQRPFEPEAATRTFQIAAPDYLDTRFLPNVTARLRRGAPHCRVVLHSLAPGTDYQALLSDGNIDLVVANWDSPPPQLHIAKLFEDPIVCIMRADCAYARRTEPNAMTLDDYLALPHVAPTRSPTGQQGVIDTFLARQGLQRNIAVESPYFGAIPHMLAQSDLALTTGRQFISNYEEVLGLKAFTVPLKFPPMRFYQLWHERVHHAMEHRWLREQVMAVAEELIKA